MENNPYFNKIIGIPNDTTPETREKLDNWIQKGVETQGGEFIEKYEVHKTEQEIQLIDFADKAAAVVAQRYGATKVISIPLNNIHILVNGGTREYSGGEFSEGAHSPKLRSIFVDRQESQVDFCMTLFHELLHVKSHSALQVVYSQNREAEMIPYRSGVSIISRDGSTRYFETIEEGIIGYLTDSFYREVLRTNLQFKDEVSQIDSGQIILKGNREEERATLNVIAKELAQKHPELFSTSQEVIDEFCKAQFSGKLMKVIRLAEQAFGQDVVRNFRKHID